MKAEDFRGLVEQLGDLTEVQRAALAATLTGNEPAMRIEAENSGSDRSRDGVKFIQTRTLPPSGGM